MTNYSWYLNQTLEGFEGKWVAIADESVVAADEDLMKLTAKVKALCALEHVSFVKVPPKDALVYAC